ncbi:hypothetical protein [Yersinia pseudotuberculosis]|uniref:hypothetical protein n=1 Tax=Yersinia pseudotuberculosis TaxID=633 RepID=UPI0005AD693D|nr:hypothetical protein [Yersinia pseudotuberculosis]AJJ70072.1 hypothetical protein BZ23_711 [Yersinia pseudotuberculosis]CNK14835.1 putative bacteriophage coat protein [Yersinia pseudotuberculosis]
MANSFDFELTATDQASASIQRIDEAVKNLLPDLDRTRDGLKLGGQESAEGLDDLNDRLKGMGQLAREGVQFVGDLVPPLKMVGEIGSAALKFGAVGGIAYTAVKAVQGLKSVAEAAYSLDTAAKNAGMSVDDFSRLAGAMQILGIDGSSAQKSVEGLYKTLNDPLWARNDTTQALLVQNGIQIERNKDGTANVLKTMENIAKVFPSIAPHMQKTLADALGLDANTLSLLREGTRFKELLTKADKIGLTVDPETNAQLVELNAQLNEASAVLDGLFIKAKTWGAQKLLTGDASFDPAIAVAGGLVGLSFASVSNAPAIAAFENSKKYIGDDENSFAHGDKQKDILHRARVDDKFKDTLSFKEKTYLTLGYPDKDFTQKLNDQYGEAWEEQEKKRLEAEKKKLAAPDKTPYSLTSSALTAPKSGQDALGVRNNNPGNLRVAPNSTGKNGGFSTFANPQEGIAALARQLQLYGDRGNNTLSGILHTYAPSTENNTQGYINAVSGATGANPYERLNLHSPEVLKKLVTSIIGHENGYQPYSSGDIDDGINASINDDRWKGLRNPNILLSQRQSLTSDNEEPNLAAGDITTNNRPSILTPQPSSGHGITDINQGAGVEKSEVEITLISERNGERQKITAARGAKVSTSMNY